MKKHLFGLMKKCLILLILCLCSFIAKAQHYHTPGVPAGTNSFSPTFRYKGASPDSLSNLWLSINNKWYQFPSYVQFRKGVDSIVFSSEFMWPGTIDSPLRVNLDTLFSLQKDLVSQGNGHSWQFQTNNVTFSKITGIYNDTTTIVLFNSLPSGTNEIILGTNTILGNGIELQLAPSATFNYAVDTYETALRARGTAIPDMNILRAVADSSAAAISLTAHTIYNASDSLISNRVVHTTTHTLYLGDESGYKARLGLDPINGFADLYGTASDGQGSVQVGHTGSLLTFSGPQWSTVFFAYGHQTEMNVDSVFNTFPYTKRMYDFRMDAQNRIIEFTDNENYRGVEYNHLTHYRPNSYTLLSKYMADSLYLLSGDGVPSSRTLTINGTTFDLSANRTWSVGTLTTSNFVDSETPSGTINSSNVTFTLANTPTTGTVKLYRNGVRVTNFTMSTNTITMLSAPLTGDSLLVDYRK